MASYGSGNDVEILLYCREGCDVETRRQERGMVRRYSTPTSKSNGENKKCGKSELNQRGEIRNKDPVPSTPNPSLSVQTSGRSARAAHCARNEGRCRLRVCRWPVRSGRSESLQPRRPGEWRAERLDYMWPGSDLLTTKAGGGENGRIEGTRRSGAWERRTVDFALRCSGNSGVVTWSEMTDSEATACARFTQI